MKKETAKIKEQSPYRCWGKEHDRYYFAKLCFSWRNL